MAYLLVALGLACFGLMAISGIADYYMKKEEDKEG